MKKLIYGFARTNTTIPENYFQKLLDYDYTIDHELWTTSECPESLLESLDGLEDSTKEYLKDYPRNWCFRN